MSDLQRNVDKAKENLSHALRPILCNEHVVDNLVIAVLTLARAEAEYAIGTVVAPDFRETVPPPQYLSVSWHILLRVAQSGVSETIVAQWSRGDSTWGMVGAERFVTPGMAWDAGWRWRRVVNVES